MSDSVGKITLDLEVKSDLEGQINKVSETVGQQLKENLNNSTKGIFDGMSESMNKSLNKVNESLKSGLGKMKDNIRSTLSNAFDVAKNVSIKMPKFNKPEDNENTSNNDIKQPVTRPPPKLDMTILKSQQEDLERVLENTNKQIDLQQEKIARLKEEYAQAFNVSRKNKLEEDLTRADARLNSLIAKSDRYGFKLADIDEKLGAFAAAQSRASESGSVLEEKIVEEGVAASETGSKLSRLSEMTRLFSNGINSSIGFMKRMGSQLKSLGSSSDNCNKSFGRMNLSMGMIMRQFFTWMIVLPALMKAVNALATGLWNDLKTNDQFNQSLNQIKTNLMVAFTPIFYAILPAINALMSALATLTAYFASFISAIFGKTYQQSFQATQGLIDAKQAMGAYGDAAKKASKDIQGLVGIDEINNLSKSNSGADTSKVPTLTQPSMDMSAVDTQMQALADKVKKILGEIFAPMKEAWDREGKATIDALKYALDEVWRVIKDIGQSFLDVWTNGTGLKICTDILKLLQTIFNIVGDIAKAFATAWEGNNLGTKVVQALADAFDNILKLLNDIGQTFREVWNSGIGVEICTNILEILKNVFTIIGQIANSFRNAWNDGLGKQIVTDILNLLNGCLRNIQDITASFSKAWESNGDTVCNAILLILDDIIGTISDIANKWANAWESNGNGDQLMNSLLSALGKIFSTIGDIGQGIRESLGNAADELFPILIQFATNLSIGLGNLADGFKIIWDNGGKVLFDGIVQLIAKVAELALVLAGNAFKEFSEIFKALSPILGVAADAVGVVIQWITKLVDWLIQGAKQTTDFGDNMNSVWDGIQNKTSECWTYVKQQFDNFRQWLDSVFATDWSQKFGSFGDVVNAFFKVIQDVASGISTTFNGIVEFIVGTFTGNWGQAWQGVVDTFEGIFKTLEAVAKAPMNGVIALINGVITAINDMIAALNSLKFDFPDWVPKLGGKSFGLHLSPINPVPYLATGGIIDSPTLAMVGESGKEAVMPLENNTGWIKDLAGQIAGMIGTSNSQVSTTQQSGDIIFMIDGSVIGKVALSQLQKMQRQGKITVLPT